MDDDHRREKENKNLLHDHMKFHYGPTAGGLLESVSMEFSTPGEKISSASVNPAFKMRELSISGKSINDALLMVERINGYHSASFQIGFLTAVEKALNIKVPDDIMNARILQLELERIRSNLNVMERLCLPAGFGVPANQLSFLKEETSRLIGNVSGHRYFFGTNLPGLCRISVKSLNDRIKEVLYDYEDILDALLSSKIFVNRLQKNGFIKDERMIGPAARASGFPIDARADSNSLDYSNCPFSLTLRDEGDSFARFMVRAEEIPVSRDIIISSSQKIRNNLIYEEEYNGSGNGISRIESPSGDLFFMVSIEDGIVKSLEFSSPSMVNIGLFKKSMPGNVFTDFHFNWESFGIWLSEVVNIK